MGAENRRRRSQPPRDSKGVWTFPTQARAVIRTLHKGMRSKGEDPREMTGQEVGREAAAISRGRGTEGVLGHDTGSGFCSMGKREQLEAFSTGNDII